MKIQYFTEYIFKLYEFMIRPIAVYHLQWIVNSYMQKELEERASRNCLAKSEVL